MSEAKLPAQPEARGGGPFRQWAAAIRDNPFVNLAFCLLVPLITQILLEWVARGDLGGNQQGNGFVQAVVRYYGSYLISYALLVALYVFICYLAGSHALATGLVGLAGLVPAVVTQYKLTMRGEPFLPWDLAQIGDLLAVKDNVEFSIRPNIIISAILLAALTALAAFVKVPFARFGRRDWFSRLMVSGAGLAGALILLFGIFLSPAGTRAVGIREDMWMQDRYYRVNGVLTGFLTNLQLLNIRQPEAYSPQAARELAGQAERGAQNEKPLFEGSYGATAEAPEQTPDIIFLMAESFWDVTRLPGITYDQPLLANLRRLAAEGATGWGHSPSFGGGTCDVEFEALTGFSKEFLPAGSKPFQQYVTNDTFSLPQALKSRGYSTTAIHGYGGRFWNRDMAYPNLGIDTFIASEDFVNPELRRGFISDNAMVDRIIEEYENRQAEGPVFIHAVTMQNHTTYSRSRYPDGELVKVTAHPPALPDATIGQLEDCATGIREMDAALGKLADYLDHTDRPTILVFWGDHLNPMSDGYTLFEETGYIEKGDTASPMLRQVPLLIWSNYDDTPIDLGVLATYNITPVMMDLYGLEKPMMFNFLAQGFPLMRGHTQGVTIGPDSSFGYDMDDAQQQLFDAHAILQYDLLFGS